MIKEKHTPFRSFERPGISGNAPGHKGEGKQTDDTMREEAKLPPSGFDREVYGQLQRMTSGSDVLGQILIVYLETTLELLEKIDKALEAGDMDLLRLHAHALKSPSAQLGLMRMAALCKMLEDGAASGLPVGGLVQACENVKAEFCATKPDLLLRIAGFA